LYASLDGGKTFNATGASVAGALSLHSPFGQDGDVWAVASSGLYRSLDSAQTFTKLAVTSTGIDLSFGKAQTDGGYPSLYLSGSANGYSGILRSDDAGATWLRINDDAHQFGYISHVSGDPRAYGRVYLGTGGRGIIYGDVRP
jgi:xyloglucan-specific exo-beta-1,4-glucanase